VADVVEKVLQPDTETEWNFGLLSNVQRKVYGWLSHTGRKTTGKW